jgi:FeS assembly SUF system protein
MDIFKLNEAPPAIDVSAFTPSPPTKSEADEFDVDPVKTLELKPKIVDQLVTVFDPEIPVNIYELGLIYDILVDVKGLAVIKMTLTAPGCPAAVALPAEVQGKVKAVDGVTDARVDLVWEPPWDKARMTDAARLALGIFD